MVGRNLGASQPQRATEAVAYIARAALILSGAGFGLLALISPRVMMLFSRDPQTIIIGANLLRVLGFGYVARALTWVFDGAQSGAGDTVSPMVINLLTLWAVQIPLAMLLSGPVGLGARGIWLALTASWILQASLLALRFRQGQWQLKRV